MSFLLAGFSHKTSPARIREPLAAAGPGALQRLLAERGWQESVVLSTCNRFEVYAAGEDVGALAGLLESSAGAGARGRSYRLQEGDAVRHLFRVAAGLDSLVLGETEILRQVKQAYESARDAGTTGKLSNVVFQRALFVGKAARTLTGISAGQPSAASAAVELARRLSGGLGSSAAMVLGAGDTAEKVVRHLRSAKVRRLLVSNRTGARAQALAALHEAETVRWEDFPALLPSVDVLVAATSSPAVLVDRPMVERSLAGRGDRPLFLIDLAVPRNIAADLQGFERVDLYGLEDLQAIVSEGAARRRAAFQAAEAIVEARAAELEAWMRSAAGGRETSLSHA
jgi:glutamyl-tRNA reductase